MATTAPAYAVTQKTKVKYYRVPSVTAIDAIRYMNRRGPRVDRTHALASIETRLRDIKIVETNYKNRCGIKRAKIITDFTITLPRGTRQKKMSKKMRSAWRSFEKKARWHENQHKAIFLSCYKKMERRLAKIRRERNCKIVHQKVNEVVDSELRSCARRNRAFDIKESRRLLQTPLYRLAAAEQKLNKKNKKVDLKAYLYQP